MRSLAEILSKMFLVTIVIFVALLLPTRWLWQSNIALALAANPLIFDHVTLIDGTRTPAQSDMTVMIVGNQIHEIAKTGIIAVPKSATVIDATGKFLIPGLWDMHVHHPNDNLTRKIFFPLYIANGITGIRDMFGDRYHPTDSDAAGLDAVNHWRKDTVDGTLLAPRIVASSAIIDGVKPVWKGSIPVANAFESRQAVRWSKERGADFVKVYSLVSREAYFALAEEAKKLQIPFAGHVPLSVSATEASNAGQKSIEHLTGILLACSTRSAELQQSLEKSDTGTALLSVIGQLQPKQLVETYNQTKAKSLFATFVKNHTWQVPTLTVLRGSTFLGDAVITNDPRLKYIPVQARQNWQQRSQAFAKATTSDLAQARKAAFQKHLDVVGSMYRAGVEILAGTDTLNPYILPGFSLHDELELLVNAGLTPMAALQTATLKPAQYLGLSSSLGTVERGKIADLVLLEANPLEHISNTQKIAAVVVNGRLIDKAQLQQLLAQAERAANAQTQQWNFGFWAASFALVVAALSIVRYFKRSFR